MPIATHPAETDLLLPLPGADDRWDPHTIHTHYFGFNVPEAKLGGFIYVRYQPAFPLCQGGVIMFRGVDNLTQIDVDFIDYEMTMPWPEIDGGTITTANGLCIEFTEPGRVARTTYTSPDGSTSIDLTHTAISPLLVRGHVMPGEEDHHGDPGAAPGGSEQFMHCVGEVVLHGERFAVDCPAVRDRSWRQVRVERRDAVPIPPVGWSPMYFGDDLVFNQISFEDPATDPAWTGLYELPPGRPTHHFAWVIEHGEAREIVRVRRNVLEYHPDMFMSMKQEIEAEAEDGKIYRFRGEAIAAATIPAWPNVSFHDSVYRWEDEQGRVTHQTYQEIWFDKYQRMWKQRRAGG